MLIKSKCKYPLCICRMKAMVRNITLPEPQGISFKIAFILWLCEWNGKSKIFFRWTFFLLKIYLFYQLWNWSLRSHTSHIDASTGTERTNHLIQYQFVYITTIKQYYKPKPSKDYMLSAYIWLYVTFWFGIKIRVIPSM